MSMPKIMLGCDPELFVRNKETGKFVAPYQMIPGDKATPHPVPHGAVQVDGMAVEFNIDPANSLEEWRNNINSVRKDLADLIPLDCELVTVPTADFDPDYWNSLPKDALEIGCVPDYNVYTGQENPRPNGAAQFFRSAAGHIHLGWTKDKDITDVDHIADCVEVAKQLDFYVGVPSGLWDTDMRRRQLYGKAGSIRVKSYGLEYRTPSNMWLNSTAATDFVYNASIAAVSDLFEDIAMRTKFNDGWAQQYINGTRVTTQDTMFAIGQYSNRLVKCGLYELRANVAPPKPKPKIKAEAGMAVPEFRWRGMRIDQLDADMIPVAVRDLEVMGDPGRHIPALLGHREALRQQAERAARVRPAANFGVGHDRIAADWQVRIPPQPVAGRPLDQVFFDDIQAGDFVDVQVNAVGNNARR
jgi:hypothetical protein